MQKRFKIIATVGVISLLVICWFSAAARACCVGTAPTTCHTCKQVNNEWVWVDQCVGCESCSAGTCFDDDTNCTSCQDCTDHNCVTKSGEGCGEDSDCTSCQECDENCDCVKKSGEECGEDSDCEGCKKCNENCVCEDDTSKCFFCKVCVDGSCISTCNACQKCVMAEEYVCVDDCKDCKECEFGYCVGGCDEECEDCVEWSPGFYECDHKCLNCEWPEYCVDACYCTDCSTEENTDMCRESKTYACPVCHVFLGPACSEFNSRDYEDSTIVYCTSSYEDCEEQDDSLCYTEYTCVTDNAPGYFHMCQLHEGQLDCVFMDWSWLGWCTMCTRNIFDEGDPYYVEEATCPSAEWPP